MEKQIITFSANEQQLEKTGGLGAYSSNKVSYIEAVFALGDNWSGYDSVRAVWSNDYKTISTVLDSNGHCLVPHEVLTARGKVRVNLVGSISVGNVLTDRITSYPVVALVVDAVAKTDGSETAAVTPSQFEQFAAVVKEDADRAETSASNAEASAQSASGSATASANSATASATSAGESEQSKTQAQTYAQNAYNSAVSAESAKDDAEDARDEIRSMRAEAVTLPPGSDATASYSDGLLSLGIPKGNKGEKGNTGNPAGFGTVSATVDDSTGTPSVEVTASGADTAKNFAFSFHNLKGAKGDKGDTGEVTLAQLGSVLPTDTASGSIASFSDGSDIVPAESVVIGIEPIQDLHGYDKPWPAGGGVNILDPSVKTLYGNGDGARWYEVDGYTLKANTTYVFKYFIVSGESVRVYIRSKADGSYLAEANGSVTYTPTEDTLVYFQAYRSGLVSDDNRFGLYTGTAESTWTPYTNICPISGWTGADIVVSPTTSADDGTTYPISWQTEAGTVYGGTLDVVSGVLTVTHANIASYAGETLPSTWICDRAVYAEGVTPPTGSQVVYELATPQTYNLTPTEVDLLLGTNNVWADTGDTEVTYKADIQGYIDKKINALI